jgi:hypothetical protein
VSAGIGHFALDLQPQWKDGAPKGDGQIYGKLGRGAASGLPGGLGIANLSAWDVEDDLGSGRLREIRLADAEPEPLAIWAVYPTARMVPAKVRAFVDALEHILRRSPHQAADDQNA